MYDLLLKRASVRKYLNKEIEEDILNKILHSAFLGPSGHNARVVEVILIKDKETLNKLSYARDMVANMLHDAYCCIVVIADMNKSSTCIEDSVIALENMHLTALENNVGSCFIQIRLRETKDKTSSEEYVRNILNIPSNYLVEGILSLGYPKDKIKPKYAKTKIHYERYK